MSRVSLSETDGTLATAFKQRDRRLEGPYVHLFEILLTTAFIHDVLIRRTTVCFG